ncbi:hypothetical protein MNBD_GAMMA05-947 [hydrothermal vent metagenome]|uniref:PpiC domain-containing protein n=1 Tax=hydrothermal vent metagenome TaxID=652676 RepID=A0A3B0WP29_9ZZZZ
MKQLFLRKNFAVPIVLTYLKSFQFQAIVLGVYKIKGVEQLNPKFEQIVSRLKLNTYSKLFKTDLGWHVAAVNNRRDTEIMPYEQAKTVIHNNLQQQAIKTLAKRLIEDANIKLIKL